MILKVHLLSSPEVICFILLILGCHKLISCEVCVGNIMNLEIETKPTTDHCDFKGSQSSAINEQKLEDDHDVVMTDVSEPNGDFEEDVEMIDVSVADIDSKDTSGDKKALTVKEEKVTLGLSEKEEIEKKASSDEENTEKIASTGIYSTEKEASTDRKETEKEESTDRKEAEKEASTDKEEIEKETSKDKVETEKEASTGRKETEEAFTDKEKTEKDQYTVRKETEKEASTDKEEIEKESSTGRKEIEKEASTGRKETEEATIDKEKTEKEASTGRKETEEASTDKEKTEKEASTSRQEREKEASTDKEEIEKEASADKEEIEKEASTDKAEIEKEASSNKEAGKESFSGTEASTEKDDTYKKTCVEKEFLGDKGDTDKETERTENQQTGSSPNGSVDESLDKNNEHLAEHSPLQLNSQSTEDVSTTDSLTGPDPSEEKDDMGACVKKPKHDEESSAANTNKNTIKTRSKARSSRYGDRDTEQYRMGYPDQQDNRRLNENVKFYKGEIESVPDGDYIDEIHKSWKGNYRLLEGHHGYIQWIFPIRENGMNFHAQPLQLHEAEAIKSDPDAHARVLRSYEMMLDFYGMKLINDKTGTIARADNYEKRFKNLTRNTHNYLRITRILKSLGELGYEHLKKPFLDFILEEALNESALLHATLSSCENYWIGTIKDDQAREELYQRIEAKKS